jgi:hypothetical protein
VFVFFSFSHIARSQSAELCHSPIGPSVCVWSRSSDNWPSDDVNSGLHNQQQGEMHTNTVSFSVNVGAFARITVRYRVPLVQTVTVSNIPHSEYESLLIIIVPNLLLAAVLEGALD